MPFRPENHLYLVDDKKCRALFVHSYFKPRFEQEEIVRTEREQLIVAKLKEKGVNAEHCMLTLKGSVRRAQNYSGSLLFPVDKKHTRDGNHYSQQLADYIDFFKPEVVIFKGMGFKLPYRLYLKTKHRFRVGFIVGGGDTDVLSPFTDFIFSESPFQTAEDFKGIPRSCKIIYLPKLVPQEKIKKPQKNKIYDIASVGNLVSGKNFKSLKAINSKHRIAIVGDGPLKDELLHEFSSCRNIELLGSLSKEKTLELIAQSKVLVHPSLAEGVPRVIYEAFSQGVPVIGLRGVLKKGMRDGVEGVLVNTEGDISSAVDKVLHDNSLYLYLSENALSFSKEHLSSNVLEKVLDLMVNVFFGPKGLVKKPIFRVKYRTMMKLKNRFFQKISIR
jgi:glycosyltransferase involved in cell wall biosynthesis